MINALRRAGAFLAILVFLCACWEIYKWVGAQTDGKIPFTQISLPVRPDDKSMPHIWTIIGSLFDEARRGGDLLIWILLGAAWWTWTEALLGFVMGSVFGFLLGAVLARFSLLERGIMPYVVASQTVPLLAIAPMVVIGGSRFGLPAWVAVSLISAYLTFFAVTINTLRGLRSPSPTAVELMRSYAAGEFQTLLKLRLPAAMPYIFTALKVSATTSVIGAIVGELPSGIAEGLGRVLLTFSQYYISGPEKLYASVLGASLLGITFTLLVTLAEKWLLPKRVN